MTGYRYRSTHLTITVVWFVSLDMAAERNALMERIYPRLKEFAQDKGYEFQVGIIEENNGLNDLFSHTSFVVFLTLAWSLDQIVRIVRKLRTSVTLRNYHQGLYLCSVLSNSIIVTFMLAYLSNS